MKNKFLALFFPVFLLSTVISAQDSFSTEENIEDPKTNVAFEEAEMLPEFEIPEYIEAVSYTHLTLPTICSV